LDAKAALQGVIIASDFAVTGEMAMLVETWETFPDLEARRATVALTSEGGD
jgi:hypothetical protein